MKRLACPIRLYEAMWVIDAHKGRNDFAQARKELTHLVNQAGGEMINCEKWEERKLAYPIRDLNQKKHRRGLYVISHFNAPPVAVARIERNAQLAELVLRVLITLDEDGLDTALPSRGIDEEERRETRERRRPERRRRKRSESAAEDREAVGEDES